MKRKIYAAVSAAAVLVLFASACSSDNSDSENRDSRDASASQEASVPATAAVVSETTATAADAEVPLPAAPVAETTTTTSSTSTTTTSSAPETSEPPSAATSSTTTSTTTTTSVAPATTISTTTTTTTTSAVPATRQQSQLRPRQNNTTQLPLPADTPRDRYVPGLAAINIYSQTNDQGSPEVQAKLEETSIYLRYIGNYQPYVGAIAENRDTAGTFRQAAKLLEDALSWLGFTPQNVCGAPAGYSFTDLLEPTREWSEELKVYSGDAIFTTDRLLELHGGERINPEANLDFYIRQAVQTTHDALRLTELLDETEAPQLILCRAFLAPSGEVPEFANGAWYALLTPGIQPRESLLSQGTYHVKEISRNGNKAWIWICHPTLGARGIGLHWREAGYRAEVHGDFDRSGCQAAYEAGGYTSDVADEEVIKFSFGERVFSADNLLGFPRS